MTTRRRPAGRRLTTTLDDAYQDSGELLSRLDTATGETTRFETSALGHLRGVTRPSGAAIEYVVDGLGRRVGKRVVCDDFCPLKDPRTRSAIMEKQAAESVLKTIADCSRRVDESTKRIKDTCDDETFQAYRSYAGRIMGNMFTEVVAPIYEEYPELAPSWYKTGERSIKVAKSLSMAESIRDELTSLMDTVYERTEAAAMVAAAASEEPGKAMCRSGFHEVLMNISETKAYLLVSCANDTRNAAT